MTAGDVKAKVRDIRDRISETDAAGSAEQVKRYVQENPGKALLISVGAGFLLGLLLRGDDDGDDD